MNFVYHLFSVNSKKEDINMEERNVVKVIKEKKNLPMKLASPIKLTKLVGIYDIYWKQNANVNNENEVNNK